MQYTLLLEAYITVNVYAMHTYMPIQKYKSIYLYIYIQIRNFKMCVRVCVCARMSSLLVFEIV